MDFGPCPAQALPANGVLITPYASAPITLAAILYFGTLWGIFFYAFGYLYFWRIVLRPARVQMDPRLLAGRER